MERSHDILDRSQINFRPRGFTSTDLRCSIIPCKTMALTIGTRAWLKANPSFSCYLTFCGTSGRPVKASVKR
jgi:hypothetical protein